MIKILAERGFQRGSLGFNDLNLAEDYRPFNDNSVQFLVSEGLVAVDNIVKPLAGGFTMMNPLLTSKGLAYLSEPVILRGERKSPLEGIDEVASGNRSFWQVGDLIGGVLGGPTKSMGG
jgi:hypothetical protein